MPERSADIIIVGGGPSGLYAAYQILKRAPATSIILLEKNKSLGGRAGNARFRGAKVVTGAGIGRAHKDFLLADIMRELGLPVNTWPMRGSMEPGPLRKLRAVVGPAATRETFEHYGKRVLGAAEFTQWIAALGYTDLFLANAYDTVLNYGLEDFSKYKHLNGFSVPWADLIKGLANAIKNKITIIRECTALSIDEAARSVKTSRGTFKWHRELIVATTIDGIRNLLPDVPEYKYIRGQVFKRVYAQFAPGPALPITELTVVGGPLQKIIPIDADKRIYMIAYNDNAAAEESPDYHKELVKIFGPDVPKIAHIRTFYWPIGTHYTAPHPYDPTEFRARLIRPRPGIYVVGEAVSVHQGWTQGAFETVHAALRELFPNGAAQA